MSGSCSAPTTGHRVFVPRVSPSLIAGCLSNSPDRGGTILGLILVQQDSCLVQVPKGPDDLYVTVVQNSGRGDSPKASPKSPLPTVSILGVSSTLSW